MADVTDATDFLLRNPGVNGHDLALDAGIIITRRESLSAGLDSPAPIAVETAPRAEKAPGSVNGRRSLSHGAQRRSSA
jgi:hypothetical protein